MTAVDSYKHGGGSPCEMSGFRITGLDSRKGVILGLYWVGKPLLETTGRPLAYPWVVKYELGFRGRVQFELILGKEGKN